jgi:hypothetical protein
MKIFLIRWCNSEARFLVRAEDHEKAKDAFIDCCEKSGNLESMEKQVGVANVRISITVTATVPVNLAV